MTSLRTEIVHLQENTQSTDTGYEGSRHDDDDDDDDKVIKKEKIERKPTCRI